MSLDTWREKTLSSSGELGEEIPIASARSRPNWCVSRSTFIVAVGSGDIRAAKEASVYNSYCHGERVAIQLEAVLVASLARPGGNVTGLATLRPELSGKRLELLKETVPRLSRVAVFTSPGSGDHAQILKELNLAAGPLGVQLQHLDIRSPKDFETAFQAATKGRAEAVLVQLPGPILTPRRKGVAELAVKSRLPLMYEGTEVVEARGAHVLRREQYRPVPSRCHLRRQDSKRRQAR